MRELMTLYHMLLGPSGGASHAERLEAFYGPQASHYDSFRKRLLHGRESMFEALPVAPEQTWVDLGAGTGASLDFMGERTRHFAEIQLVDLSASLLAVAEERVAHRGLEQVTLHESDATTFVPNGGKVDLVTFSYSLTMIPDWFAALENARRMLKPGGHIGIVDFYVARKHVVGSARHHGPFTRHFWPFWFANDNVFLSPDHLPWLTHHFEEVERRESVGSLPYLPLTRVPYYYFIGKTCPS